MDLPIVIHNFTLSFPNAKGAAHTQSTREYPTIMFKPQNKLLYRNLIKDEPFQERMSDV